MRHAFDEAGADRIGGSREHNWHGIRRLQQRPQGRSATGDEDLWGERDQIGRASA